MITPWPVSKLRDIADIRVSNVDKKVRSSEKPVKLCNYMDVYSNEYVRNTVQFMEGSASPAEIERFGLKSGDVVITKDSESPDDIGIPAVISEDIGGLVCGYHLALIRPDKDEVDPVYLAKQISTSRVARYFALRASGSTRFGLPIGTIEEVEIPKPSKPEQTQIATILSTIDKAIEQTEAIIAKQQRIKTGLMQDLLTHGIDEHGNLRSEETHEFKDSPLGRIPVEWNIARLGNLFFVQLGKMLNQHAVEGKELFPYLGNKNVQWDHVDLTDLQQMNFNEAERVKFKLRANDILVCEGGEVGRTALWRAEVNNCFFQKAIHRLRPKKNNYLPVLFPRFMRWTVSQGFLSDFTSQTSIAHLTKEKLESVLILIPRTNEQERLIQVLDEQDALLQCEDFRLKKLHRQKTALMQDLLTGKVRVTPLLEAEAR